MQRDEASRSLDIELAASDVITSSAPILETPQRQPDRLAPADRISAALAMALDSLVRTEVIPRLAQRAYIPLLTDLVRVGDVDGAMALVQRATLGTRAIHAHAALLEAVSWRLGYGWSADTYGDVDVTIGLCTLQTVLRRLEQPSSVVCRPTGSALVAPHPGERHGLGAALSARALRAARWHVRYVFPADVGSLASFLADEWFDLLDLSLSPAFCRSEQLDALTATITVAREASRNPALAVAVSGHAFVVKRSLVTQVGADWLAGDPPYETLLEQHRRQPSTPVNVSML